MDSNQYILKPTKNIGQGLSPNVVSLTIQQQLRSLQAAVDSAFALLGGLPFEQIITLGGWELKFGAPKKAGLLPVLFHALPIH